VITFGEFKSALATTADTSMPSCPSLALTLNAQAELVGRSAPKYESLSITNLKIRLRDT